MQRCQQGNECCTRDQREAKRGAAAMRQVRQERADDRELNHALVGHRGKGVAPAPAVHCQMCAAVAAEIAGRNDRTAVRTGHERRPFERQLARFAGPPACALSSLGPTLLHPPPLM